MLPFILSATSLSARLLHPESCYVTQNQAVAGDENILELLQSFICAGILLPIYFFQISPDYRVL